MIKRKESIPKVAAYYRYSSDKWAQKDNSEERQKEKCLGLIAERKWHLVEEFSDKETSGDDTKPDLMRLKDRLETDLEIDVLVVDDLSRLTRKGIFEAHEDLVWLRDNGVKICQAKDGSVMDLANEQSQLILQFDVYKNNIFLKDLAKASAGGMKTKFKQKRLGWMGPAPLGFDIVKRHKDEGPSYLVANGDLKFVKEIFQKFLAGATIRSLALILEKTERHTKKEGVKAKDPSAQSVKNILRNSIYCGIRCLGVRNVGKHASVSGKKERFVYNVNPLEHTVDTWEVEGLEKAVSVEDFQRVQKMLDANKVSHRRKEPSAGHRYSSYLICKNCGGHMVADYHPRKGKPGASVYYRCAAANQAGRKCREEKPYNRQVYEKELDAYIWRSYAEFLSKADVHISFVESLVQELKKRHASASLVGSKKLNELALKQQKYDSAWKHFENEKEVSPDILKRITDLGREVERLKAEIDGGLGEQIELIDYAEQQYLAGLKTGGPQKYIGCCYKLAADISTGKVKWSNRQEQVKAVKKVVSEGMHANHPNAIQFEFSDGRELSEVLVPISADIIFDQLKAMNLNHIKLDFQLGVHKGRPKRILSGFEWVFSDGGIKHIGMDLGQRRA